MVNSKKLLSLFLAVVMVFSALTVMASAYTRVETEGTADIDVKYTVEKVDTVPANGESSLELSGDNFYAVTVWMKSAKPVDIFIVPFHYNKTLFSPITLTDGEVTYPYGAGMDQDTYYSDMGEGAIYAYSLGDYMNNTGMYKADGSSTTLKAQAKCIGLGNSNSAGITITTELVSPDHTLYNKWGAGLPENTGVLYTSLNVATKTKTAYLNTIEGIATYTDWVRMFTVYFDAIADDVTGAEFGVFTDDCFTVDGNYDAKGLGYFQSATNYDAQVPTMNIVSNAVIEAPAGPEVAHEKFMGRMDNWGDATATIFDAGFVGRISNLDVELEDDGKQVKNITSIVVEITRGEETLTGNAYQIYAQDDGSYLFRAVVKNANIADNETVSYKYIVTLSNGDELTATGSTTFASIYSAAKANYDAANA
ncbi:MAG: hypothetical protein IJN94_05065 [Clostridia bacterium]|nr:hypothetical protein [Clostridia bacterium]